MVKTIILEDDTEEKLNNTVDKYLIKGYNKLNTVIRSGNIYQQMMYKER